MMKNRPYTRSSAGGLRCVPMGGLCHAQSMSAKKPPRPTFAEIVAEVPEAPAIGGHFSYSIPRPWITVDGHRWHLRGDAAYEGKDLYKVLRRSDVLAFHDYMDKRSPIEADEREQFWDRAMSLMEASEHSNFVGYEYKSPDGGRCMVVYEFC